jgi:hypothetical protein
LIFLEKPSKTIKQFSKHTKVLDFGLGGYGGIRLKTKQILKYEDEYGD